MTELYFDDIEIGSELARLDKGRISPAHIMRWSAAVENFHRIHYDRPFAVEHDKLPDVLINGSWKQHVLVQLIKDGVGPLGWLWRLKFRYLKMDVAGDSIKAVARVTGKHEFGGLGYVTLSIEMTNQNDEVSTAGGAIAVLPLRGGRSVPYPFVAGPGSEALSL